MRGVLYCFQQSSPISNLSSHQFQIIPLIKMKLEKIKISKIIKKLFNSNQLNHTSVNGYIQIIERTNIMQIFPVIYKLDNLIIHEFPKKNMKKKFNIHNNFYKKSY